MTERVQPGAKGSRYRGIEMGEAASAGGNFIVPASDPTLSSSRYGTLDETAYNAFALSTTAGSLDVTIAPGEAFVDGWLAKDTPTTVTLEPDTDGQEIVVGWNPDAVYDEAVDSSRDGADEVLIDTRANIDAMTQLKPYMVVHSVSTDASGVTASRDRRALGKSESVVRGRFAVLHGKSLPEGEELTIESDEGYVAAESYSLEGDATIDGDLVVVSNSPSHDRLEDVDPTDHLKVEKEFQVTLSSGSTPAFDGTLTNAFGEERTAFDVTVAPLNGLNETYAFNFDAGRKWNNGSWDVPLTVNWDVAPGGDLAVAVRVHRRT